MKQVLALLALFAFACGASPDAGDELGQDTEASSNIPLLYGFDQAQTGLRCSNVPGETCEIPIGKLLRVVPIQLSGCAGPMWQNSLNAAVSQFNADAAGTGFSVTTAGLSFPLLTPLCTTGVIHGPPTAQQYLTVPITGGNTVFANNVTYRLFQTGTMAVEGNNVVNFCNATGMNCTAYITTLFRSMLDQAAGDLANEAPPLTAPEKARMSAYSGF